MKIPYYSTLDNKIHNCKKGTLSYFHEERHKIQEKYKLISTSSWIWYIGFILSFYFVAKNYQIWAIITMLATFLPIIFLEVDAWIYSILKRVKS